jgi:hypothetical protein
MDLVLKYYAIDWVAMALSLYAVYLLGNKNKWGFVSFIISNTLWIVVGFMMESYAVSAGNFVFLLMNSRGLMKWINEANTIT